MKKWKVPSDQWAVVDEERKERRLRLGIWEEVRSTADFRWHFRFVKDADGASSQGVVIADFSQTIEPNRMGVRKVRIHVEFDDFTEAELRVPDPIVTTDKNTFPELKRIVRGISLFNIGFFRLLWRRDRSRSFIIRTLILSFLS